MQPTNLSYDLDPEFGHGRCRRLIRIEALQWEVRVSLSDNFHQLDCRIRHDGLAVTAISADAIRIPTTACPFAVSVLDELVGVALTSPDDLFYGAGKARRHCTHLYDIAVIAIRHARQGPHVDEYEAVVPDETTGPVWIHIAHNGAISHRWLVRQGSILSPAPLADGTLGTGFARWASEHFKGREFEAATILARTWLISIGRRYLIENAAGLPIKRNSEMIGRCFAYSNEQYESATFLRGQSRDSEDLKLTTQIP